MDTMEMKCKIQMTWDDESDVWMATSDDVPGLVLEHSSFDVLVERVRLASPELLALNCDYSGKVILNFTILRCERLAV